MARAVKPKARSLPPHIVFFLGLLDEAFSRKAWHGPNLRGALRGVTAPQAAWRPDPGRHNIWEIAVHVAYWKYAVRRRLTGAKRGSFAVTGSNWFERPVDATPAAWARDVALLLDEHQKLRSAIAGLDAAGLGKGRTREARIHMIRGIAAHDLYHTGQIQLLKRMCPLAAGS